MTQRERLNREAEKFFYLSTVDAIYHPKPNLSRGRGGKISTLVKTRECEVKVIPNLTPDMEAITAFGDRNRNGPGQKVIFKVLAKDLTPETEGAFSLNGTRYSVLGINPEYRSTEIFRWTVLAGRE